VDWRTLDPIRIHLGDLVDDIFGEPPLPLGLSDLVWAAALCEDEVEGVEGHGGDAIDYRIGKLECLRGRFQFRLCVVHKSCRLVRMESMFAPSSLSPRARRSLLRRQHAVHADSDFTRLLDSVLGSPFLTTSDLPDLDVVDGSFQAVPLSLAVTRPSSPDMVNGNFARPRGFIPRFWDAIRRSKHKSSRFIDDGQPLDGEEGELIDDEACFIDLDPLTTAADIIARLPPELSIHLLSFLDLDSIIACRAVSRTWRVYAQDNAIWRGLFRRRTDWALDLSRARFSTATTRRVSYVPSISPGLPPLSLDWWLLYKSRTQLENRWLHGKAKMARISGHSDRSVPHARPRSDCY